jgi:hypothetical protein
MMANLSPEMIRMSTNMAKNNPELLKRAQEMQEK